MVSLIGSENFAAFRHRPFAMYWTAQLFSLMGTFMQNVALGYLVYQITGSKWLLGTIAIFQLGPSLLLSLPAGVVADRVPRRTLVMTTQTTALLLAFSLATLTALHVLQVWEILVISTISGVAIAVESPARQALVVNMVGGEDLANAIAWNSLSTNGAKVIGPAIGGVATAYFGVAPVFYFNSFSFLAMIVALALMRIPFIRVERTRNAAGELIEGLQVIRRTPAILLTLALFGVVSMFAMNFPVLMPIFARDVLHAGPEGLGWMWTANGLGAVAGSLTIVVWSRAAVGPRLLLATGLLTGVGELAMAGTRTLLPTLAALAVVGWATGAFMASANASIQHRVGDAVRGRVLSAYSMIWAGSGPPGAIITAALASAGGAPFPLAVAGGACVLATLAFAPTLRRHLGQAPEVRFPTAGEAVG